MTCTRAKPANVMAAATTSVATAVMRTRTERNEGLPIGDQPVADAAHSLEGGPPERCVDLSAEVADVDLDDVSIAPEVMAPYLVEQIALGPHVTGSAQKRFEQIEFARGQVDRHVTTRAMTTARIDCQITGA